MAGVFLLGLLAGYVLSACLSTPSDSLQDTDPQPMVVDEVPTPTLIATPELEPESEPVVQRTLLGEYRITAYCACEACCGKRDRPIGEDGRVIVMGAQGTELVNQVSVACNLPFGTKLQIDGLEGEFVVQDRTAQWIQERYDGKIVDIYCDTHSGCYEYLSGKPEYMNVYVVESTSEDESNQF